MKLEFDTIEEVIDFAARISGEGEGETKTRRARKAKGDTALTSGTVEAPEPQGIPNGGNSPTLVPSDNGNFGNVASGPVFTPPGGGAFPGGPGAVAATVGAAPGPSAAVAALVQKISVRIDAAIAQGQPAQGALEWLRTQCVQGGQQSAAQATLDQIKQACLPQLGETQLESMAKLMGAV